MPVIFDQIKQSLIGVQSILVSDVQPDPNSDYWVRYVEFYTDSAAIVNRSPVLHITLYGGSQATGDKGELFLTIPSGVTF